MDSKFPDDENGDVLRMKLADEDDLGRQSIMQSNMVTTAIEIPGYRIVRNLGVVRGITVRSRSIVGNFFGAIQSLFGGNITIHTNLCEQARSETCRIMCRRADGLAAHACPAASC